mmetsp:Transcript_32099/g.65542  ORF Transcript_32099/g.65542 Transcript_32099/m.65542 type:complete len:275 (-) Transcript_32099:45-869(-)
MGSHVETSVVFVIVVGSEGVVGGVGGVRSGGRRRIGGGRLAPSPFLVGLEEEVLAKVEGRGGLDHGAGEEVAETGGGGSDRLRIVQIQTPPAAVVLLRLPPPEQRPASRPRRRRQILQVRIAKVFHERQKFGMGRFEVSNLGRFGGETGELVAGGGGQDGGFGGVVLVLSGVVLVGMVLGVLRLLLRLLLRSVIAVAVFVLLLLVVAIDVHVLRVVAVVDDDVVVFVEAFEVVVLLPPSLFVLFRSDDVIFSFRPHPNGGGKQSSERGGVRRVC